MYADMGTKTVLVPNEEWRASHGKRNESRDTARAMSEENVERMRAALDAVNLRDVEALTALLAKDAEIVPMRAALEGTVFRGPDAVAQWYAALDESWEEMEGKIESVRDLGDRVLVLGRLQGRGRGKRCCAGR